jgi:hypothetical protein
MRGMNSGGRHRADLLAAPNANTWSPRELADKGLKDALMLVWDVRDLDPNVVWGRLYRWMREHPERAAMVTVALAALVDPGVKAGEALAWTNDLAREAA